MGVVGLEKLEKLYKPFRDCVKQAVLHFSGLGYQIVIAETLRDKYYQAFLYYLTRDAKKARHYGKLAGISEERIVKRLRQVRPGIHITYTLRSYHLLGLAADIYFVIAGRIINAERLYKEFYDYLSRYDLPEPFYWNWGGYFSFRDLGHFEAEIRDIKIREEIFRLLEEKGLDAVWERLDELSKS